MLLLWYFASIGHSFPKHLGIDFDWPLRSVRIAKEVCGVDLVVSIVLSTSEPTAVEYQKLVLKPRYISTKGNSN